MNRLGKLYRLILAVVVLAGLTACQTNPATGKRVFNVISEQQEIALGLQASPEFLQSYGGPVPSPQINAYVSDLGHRLAAVSERPNLPWEFHVVDSAQINAFALPGGKVFISRGLLQLMGNEAQLAGVLGHEIGHVTALHIGQQMSQAIAIQAAAVGIGAAGAATDKDWLKAMGVGAQVGGTLYLLKFGRDQESQADELGVRYMTRLGYNPVAQVQVMEILSKAAGGGGTVEFFSTHPHPETRIQRLTQLIRQRYPNYAEPGTYHLHAERFKAQCLDPLSKLPPPRHK